MRALVYGRALGSAARCAPHCAANYPIPSAGDAGVNEMPSAEGYSYGFNY